MSLIGRKRKEKEVNIVRWRIKKKKITNWNHLEKQMDEERNESKERREWVKKKHD